MPVINELEMQYLPVPAKNSEYKLDFLESNCEKGGTVPVSEIRYSNCDN